MLSVLELMILIIVTRFNYCFRLLRILALHDCTVITNLCSQVEIAGLVSQTEYLITVTSVAGGEPVPLKSPRDNPLSVSTVFTMPSADEITNISSDGLEPGYLQVYSLRRSLTNLFLSSI